MCFSLETVARLGHYQHDQLRFGHLHRIGLWQRRELDNVALFWISWLNVASAGILDIRASSVFLKTTTAIPRSSIRSIDRELNSCTHLNLSLWNYWFLTYDDLVGVFRTVQCRLFEGWYILWCQTFWQDTLRCAIRTSMYIFPVFAPGTRSAILLLSLSSSHLSLMRAST